MDANMRDVIKKVYEFIEARKFARFSPTNSEACRGTIDVHVHSYANAVDPLELAKHASLAGMVAFVMKDSSPLTN